jgi:DNA-binding MarR family transcriptional regulator
MSDSVSPAIATRLSQVVGRFNRRLISATGGLSHGQLSALSSVLTNGPIRLAALAQIELVSAPSITRVVAELETRGLVARSADANDGRAFLIQITAAGREAILRARAARAAVIADTLADLDPGDIAAIATALPALERAIGLQS